MFARTLNKQTNIGHHVRNERLRVPHLLSIHDPSREESNDTELWTHTLRGVREFSPKGRVSHLQDGNNVAGQIVHLVRHYRELPGDSRS